MIGFAIKRALQGLLVMLIISVLAFALLKAAPGGPFDDERSAPPEVTASLNAKYRLDLPIHEQYLSYLSDIIFKGDLGPSYRMPGYSVSEIIVARLPVSFVLGFAAVALAFLVGTASGLYAGSRQGAAMDTLVMLCVAAGLAIPNFVIAPVLLAVFGAKLRWVGVEFRGDIVTSILPVVVLAFPIAAKMARLTRSGAVETMGEEFILTARAKGLSESVVVLRHALRPSLLPAVSYLAPATAGALTGSIVVERIFGINGLGNAFFTAALDRDYTVVMGLVLLYSALLVVFNVAADVAYTWLDPRIREA